MERSLLSFVKDLGVASDRPAAARAFAQAFGADTCILFLRDPDIGELLPAPGFPQTLHRGSDWQRFLANCVAQGQYCGVLPYPVATDQCDSVGLAADAAIVCVLLGIECLMPETQIALDELRLLLPLLGTALEGERSIASAQAQTLLARRVAEESRALAHVLDDARRSLHEALFDAEAQRSLVVAHSAELNAILRALPDALVVYAADGTVVRANVPALELYAQVTGTTLDQSGECDLARALWPPNSDTTADSSPEEARQVLSRALHGEAASAHLVLPSKGRLATSRHLMVHAVPIRTTVGEQTGVAFAVTDVTMLYALDEHKEEFLSIVAHELRTPLTTLKVTSQLLNRQLRGAYRPNQTAVERTEKALTRLERLVSDLLDTSRIQAGELAIRCTPCDLARLCGEVCEEQRQITGHPISFEPQSSRKWVMGDADRLVQVLGNLLSNAIKYSPLNAPVRVQLTSGDLADASHLRVAIQDSGIGIATELRHQIFERFFRAPDAPILQGSGVGLGLGLYIARNIVHRHGGKIGVESEPHHGTTFWFTLPAIEAPTLLHSTPQ